ncbi:MAG: protein-glutamate O-methyltransferase CheR [Bacteroidetes bacterium]|nr:protein-glutamate O-methyltransferase CheR [Bacteroidota bacterium]
MEEDILILTEQIYLKYGYDFSDYSKDSFTRRVNNAMIRFNIPDIHQLRSRIQESDLFFNTFLEEITVNVTEMFRDPEFYKTLRKTVLPELTDQPLIRIWHAGCSSGEEVYSMAILLKEAGLLERSLLYATDINQRVLEKASAAKFSLENINGYAENYKKTGGTGNLSDYYTPVSGMALFHEEFKNRMVFSPHNLVADQSFNEFNLILCRNVLIYFNHTLQNKVVQLFSDSLPSNGFLALGSKEGIDFSLYGSTFYPLNRRQRIWKKLPAS